MSSRAVLFVAFATTVLTPSPSLARPALHQLCWQRATGAAQPRTFEAGIACRSDDPSIDCEIWPDPSWKLLSRSGSPGAWEETYSVPPHTTSGTSRRDTSTIRFSNGVVRTCTTEVEAYSNPGELRGYTTDSSGLMSTGVFAGQYPPSGLLGVGVGVVGAEWPTGLLVFEAEPHHGAVFAAVGDPTHGQTTGAGGDSIIAMQVEGVTRVDLYGWLQLSNALDLSGAPSVSALAAATPGRVLVSGGGGAYPWSDQILMTASFPELTPSGSCGKPPAPSCIGRNELKGWRVEMKGFRNAPAGVYTKLYTFPPVVQVSGRSFAVRATVITARSGLASHPAATVVGRPGDYALTAVGAYVDWGLIGDVSSGNYLWKLDPLPNEFGASVASKDHVYFGPATITAFAIGLRLEPL